MCTYLHVYILHILNYAMQSASMGNFVNLIQYHVYLSNVMMENGEKSVPETVSGILICQWLPVQNWATVTLVSQLFVWWMDKLTWFFILEIITIRTIKFCPNPNPQIFLSDCKEPGLTNCTVTPSNSCDDTSCFVVSLQTCNTG